MDFSSGGSHVRRLHDLGDNGGGRTGYLFKNGGSMEDVLFAIRCFLNSLPEKKNVSFLVWPTSSDLRRKFRPKKLKQLKEVKNLPK